MTLRFSLSAILSLCAVAALFTVAPLIVPLGLALLALVPVIAAASFRPVQATPRSIFETRRLGLA